MIAMVETVKGDRAMSATINHVYGPQSNFRLELSERDRRWLRSIADGTRVKELHHSEVYARNQMQIVREILGVRTTSQAIALALRTGIIE
jgi:DNA-binding CsgD family transcriptional regulator